MQASSINLLATGLALLCLVRPLYGDPRRSYWANYGGYDPVDSQLHPLHRVQLFPERYGSVSAERHPVQVTQATYEVNHFQSPSESFGYPEKGREGYQGYRDFGPSDREEFKSDREKFEDEETTESSFNEEDVMEKMALLDKLLSEDSNDKDLDTNGIEDRIIPEESRRVVRQVRNQKPGFFWTLARITFETINDTRSAIKQVSDIINNSIVPDSATQSTVTSASLTAVDSSSAVRNMTTVNATETTTSSPTTTTRAPFVLTRSRLQSLIRRNILGLVRLFNIEWKDALNQSDITVKEFQKDLGNQVGIYLQDNPNAFRGLFTPGLF